MGGARKNGARGGARRSGRPTCSRQQPQRGEGGTLGVRPGMLLRCQVRWMRHDLLSMASPVPFWFTPPATTLSRKRSWSSCGGLLHNPVPRGPSSPKYNRIEYIRSREDERFSLARSSTAPKKSSSRAGRDPHSLRFKNHRVQKKKTGAEGVRSRRRRSSWCGCGGG